jgi:hypothetical protein
MRRAASSACFSSGVTGSFLRRGGTLAAASTARCPSSLSKKSSSGVVRLLARAMKVGR